MTAATRRAADEIEIRRLIDHQAEAVRAKDVDGSTFNYAPDILLFDVVNPLQRIGREASRQRAEAWFSSFEGPIGYEIRDLEITSGDDVAYSHSLNRVSGKTTDGKRIDMWWRSTVCFGKIAGKWVITHGHSSVPFDAGSGRASLDLEPEPVSTRKNRIGGSI